MSTRLPADWQNRQRLDGTYRLQVAAIEDISKPRYSVHDLSTVKGRAARQIDTDDGSSERGTTAKNEKSSGKRCWKMVLSDAADRVILAYEYQRCTAIQTLAVGDWVELVGPAEFIGPGVISLKSNNLRLADSPPAHSSPFINNTNHSTISATEQRQSEQSMERYVDPEEDDSSWIHDLPSDMFHPSSGGFAISTNSRAANQPPQHRASDVIRALDDVIIIDE